MILQTIKALTLACTLIFGMTTIHATGTKTLEQACTTDADCVEGKCSTRAGSTDTTKYCLLENKVFCTVASNCQSGRCAVAGKCNSDDCKRLRNKGGAGTCPGTGSGPDTSKDCTLSMCQ